MQSLVMAQGPDLALQQQTTTLISPNDKTAVATHPPRVVDLFALLCILLEVDSPLTAEGDPNRIKYLLRYPTDTEVVKVIRSWLQVALAPDNVPITSDPFYLSLFPFLTKLTVKI